MSKGFKIEVLLSTMKRDDISFLNKMNIQSDVLVINQHDKFEYQEFEHKGFRVRFITVNQRGLSKSRNLALSYAEGDVCLLADDDIVYEDGYPEMVKQAFENCPKAGIVVFNTKILNSDEDKYRKEIKKVRKSPQNSFYGSVRIAFRRQSVIKNGIYFNSFLGAGTQYGGGEDSLFIKDCRKKRIKIYENPNYISSVDYASSTWFGGFDEKYYFNIGVFIAIAFRRFRWLYTLYYLMLSRKRSKLPISTVRKKIKEGIKFINSL